MADLFSLGALYDPRKDQRYSDLVNPSASDFNFADAWTKGTNVALQQRQQELANERVQRQNDAQTRIADTLANLPEGANVEDAIMQAAIEGGDLDAILKAQAAADNRDNRELVAQDRQRKNSQAQRIADILNNANPGEDPADLLIRAGFEAGDPDLIAKGENIKNSRDQRDIANMMRQQSFEESKRRRSEDFKFKEQYLRMQQDNAETKKKIDEGKLQEQETTNRMLERFGGGKGTNSKVNPPSNLSSTPKTGTSPRVVLVRPKQQAK